MTHATIKCGNLFKDGHGMDCKLKTNLQKMDFCAAKSGPRVYGGPLWRLYTLGEGRRFIFCTGAAVIRGRATKGLFEEQVEVIGVHNAYLFADLVDGMARFLQQTPGFPHAHVA